MDDLIEFLRARLAEDEAVARDRLCVNCGNPVTPLRSPLGITGYTHEGGRANEQGQWEQGWEGIRCPGKIVGAEPVQNRDRVLVEVEAKRELLRVAEAAADFAPTFTTGVAAKLEDVLRRFAAAYRVHPGYRPEWAPKGSST